MRKPKSFLAVCAALAMLILTASCGTLFTGSRQDITFKGTPGTDIYNSKNERVGEVTKNGFVKVPVRKSLKSKKFVGRLDGYQPREVTVKSRFNPVALLNVIFPVPWIIDLSTGKCCKYSNEVVDVTLMPNDGSEPVFYSAPTTDGVVIDDDY